MQDYLKEKFGGASGAREECLKQLEEMANISVFQAEFEKIRLEHDEVKETIFQKTHERRVEAERSLQKMKDMMNKTELDSKVWEKIKANNPSQYALIQQEMKDKFESKINALHQRQFAPIDEDMEEDSDFGGSDEEEEMK